MVGVVCKVLAILVVSMWSGVHHFTNCRDKSRRHFEIHRKIFLNRKRNQIIHNHPFLKNHALLCRACWWHIQAKQRRSLRQTWCHQMETLSVLLVTGEFPAQRPVTRNFDIFFDLRLNKRLSKQSWGWWFEMPSRPIWRHSNDSIEA